MIKNNYFFIMNIVMPFVQNDWFFIEDCNAMQWAEISMQRISVILLIHILQAILLP